MVIVKDVELIQECQVVLVEQVLQDQDQEEQEFNQVNLEIQEHMDLEIQVVQEHQEQVIQHEVVVEAEEMLLVLLEDVDQVEMVEQENL